MTNFDRSKFKRGKNQLIHQFWWNLARILEQQNQNCRIFFRIISIFGNNSSIFHLKYSILSFCVMDFFKTYWFYPIFLLNFNFDQFWPFWPLKPGFNHFWPVGWSFLILTGQNSNPDPPLSSNMSPTLWQNWSNVAVSFQ